MAIKLQVTKGQKMQMTFEAIMGRAWRSVSRLNLCVKGRVASESYRYEAWLSFHDGLGNGGAL